ncbi:MAG TPA: cbb3-type cytochrome c oxidase N-terminal domain-containing protein, partial [Niabella sp.]|nr:cbb3-type cytochrome c oxidase N-terminal domain-containing protein [Niabella sp.]
MKQLQTAKKIMLCVLLLLAGSVPLMAQNTTATPPPSSFTLDANAVLIFAIALLAMVIGVLGYTLSASLDLYKRRKNHKSITGQVVKSLLVGFLSLGALQALGQDGSEAAAPATSVFSDVHIFRYLLLGIITLELITIFALVYWIRFFTGIEELQREKGIERKTQLKDASSWWSRVNKMKPMEEEASLDVGHSYDGIKELDNVTPPWFTIAFIASIIFGIGYLWHYHVSKAGPNQYEEYE